MEERPKLTLLNTTHNPKHSALGIEVVYSLLAYAAAPWLLAEYSQRQTWDLAIVQQPYPGALPDLGSI